MSDGQSCCGGLEEWIQPGVFKALSEPNRATILARLAQGGRKGAGQSVSEVASCCTVDLSVVSRHLRVLRNAGIVEAERRGKEILYRIRVTELVAMLRGLADALEACCPDGTCTLSEKDDNEGETDE